MSVSFPAQTLYNLADAFWLGKLGKTALVAPTITMNVVFVGIAVAMGLGSAGTTLVSQARGAGRGDDAARAAGQSLVLQIGIGSLAALGGMIGQTIERERTIAALRERESNLSAFFASVTDFIFVLDELPAGSAVSRSITDIEVAARRAAELCRQMLAYSGRGNFVIEPVDLGELVAEMSYLMQTSVSKTAILNVETEMGLPQVQGDATQIRQVAMNLVINASEAVEETSGTISVRSGVMDCSREDLTRMICGDDAQPGAFVYLEVADTGCGMDAETVDRLFDPFFSTKFTGRGLGMSAVLGIVRSHGGAMRIWSEKGKGSVFRVLFPAAQEKPDSAAAPVAAPAAGRLSGCVLLVDDEETVRTLAGRMLQRLGLGVITARNGREALDIHAELPDDMQLVLLDLTMPKLDGRETFIALRERDPALPVIISSGYSEHEIEMRFAEDVPSAFIQKPFTLETLRSVLGRLLIQDGQHVM